MRVYSKSTLFLYGLPGCEVSNSQDPVISLWSGGQRVAADQGSEAQKVLIPWRWRAKHPFSGQDCFPKINTSALCVPSWSPWTWEGSNVPKLLMGSSWWTFRPLIKSGITVINSCLLLSLSHSVSLHIFPVCVMVIVVVVVHVWKENFH